MIDEKTFYKNVGRSIRDERENQELTQGQLAKAANLSRVSLTNIENGKQNLSLHAFINIVEALKIPLERLIPQQNVSLRTIRGKIDTNEIERLARDFFEDSEAPNS